MRKLTNKEVLERFKKVHGDEYDYSLVEYFEAHTNVKIICTKNGHGLFEQIPNNHRRRSKVSEMFRNKQKGEANNNKRRFYSTSKRGSPR